MRRRRVRLPFPPRPLQDFIQYSADFLENALDSKFAKIIEYSIMKYYIHAFGSFESLFNSRNEVEAEEKSDALFPPSLMAYCSNIWVFLTLVPAYVGYHV